MKRKLKDKMTYRTFQLRIADGKPASLDEQNRSVEITLASEQPVPVFDFERFEIVNEILLMSGAELPKSRQVPLLDTHRRFDTASVLGSVRGLKTSGDQLIGRAHFSSVPGSEDAWTKVREGHLTDFSAGYKPMESQWVPEKETYSYKGRSFKGPVRVTKRWRIKEGSTVPIGADELAKARTEHVDNNESNDEGDLTMNKRLRKILESRGLPKEATEDEAWAFLETLNITREEPPEPDPIKDPEKKPEVDLDKIRSEAKGEERERIVEIDAMGVRFDDKELADTCIREGLTIDEARKRFLVIAENKLKEADELGYRKPVEMGKDERDKFRAAASDALLFKSVLDYKPENERFAPGYDELAGFSLKELARESLRIAGEKISSNVNQMVGRALETSDLPYILANVANKALFSGYETAPETWQTWCSTGNVTDFKTNYLPRISEMSDLDEVPEHGEYRYGKMAEAQESYTIATYGKLFAITRQAIINDDLGALTNIPAGHGEAAARKVGDVAYAVLTANAEMGDGVALFHADHANFVDHGSGAVPGVVTISAGILAMGVQKDLQGLRRLNIRPEYFIGPKALEGTAEVFFRSERFVDSDTVATDSSLAATRVNPYAGAYFTRVYDARLDDNDAAAWFLAGPKGKTVVVFFLNGVQTPYLESKTGWTVDGNEYKVRIDVVAKAVDWKALYMNDGN